MVTARAFNAFWVISSVTDYSFEEGDRNVHLAQAVITFAEAGVAPELLRTARRGINGNLQLVLERPGFGLGAARRNKGKGQDLEFAGARAEVKLLYDCTLPKYYGSVAADWEKLATVRDAGFPGPLFLIVFFVELPGRRYFRKRREVVQRGIRSQYRALQRELDVAPSWPADGPIPHRLTLPGEPLAAAIERRCDRVTGAPQGWHSLSDQMRDAAVAVCVWEYPGGSSVE